MLFTDDWSRDLLLEVEGVFYTKVIGLEIEEINYLPLLLVCSFHRKNWFLDDQKKRSYLVSQQTKFTLRLYRELRR